MIRCETFYVGFLVRFMLCYVMLEIWYWNLKPYGCSAHNQVSSQQEEIRA